MKKRFILPALVLIVFAPLSRSALAQTSPQSLDDYQFVARGKLSGKRGVLPERIARLDNNGQILLACLKPQTADQLRALGIKFLQSQLELLLDWRLLEFNRKEQTYTTTIHIYGPDKAAEIRRKVQPAALNLADALNSDLLSLQTHLQSMDREKNLFSILYAYILHDYSMRQFGEEIYQKPQLSEENPYWNGFAWAISPVREFNVNVTVLPAQDGRLYFVSSEALPGPNFQQMMPFVKDVAADLKVDDPGLVKTFSTFGLCNDKGELTIPILAGEWPAKLEDMAKRVYAKTVELADSPEMKEILGMEIEAQAAMLLHYELRYAVLSHLLETGFIEAPIDFDNAGKNRPSDKRNLVFAVTAKKGT